MAKFKKGVSVDTSGKITIDKSVEGVSDATRKAVEQRNANIEAGNPKANTVLGATEPTVVKTDALQRRIDARKAQGITTSPTDQSVIDTATGKPQTITPTAQEPSVAKPVDQSVMDTSTGMPQGIPEPPKGEIKTEPTTEPTPEPVTEPTKPTPEEQAKFDEQQKQQEADRIKAEEDKKKADALKAEEAKKQAEANQKGETVVKTQDEAFAILSTGGKLPKTAENAVFEERYKAYQKLNGLTNQSLADLNAKGLITSNYLDYLSKTNPERYAELNKLTDSAIKIDDINQTGERIYNKSTGKTTETISKSEEVDRDIAKIINGEKPSIRDLRKEYLEDNEKIKDLKVGLAEKDGEIEELQDEIERTYDDLRGQYPTLPKSILMGMAATQTRDLNRTLTTKMRERNILFSEYQAEKEEANARMNFEMKVVEEERANRQEELAYLQNKFNTLKTDEMWQKEKDYQTEAARIAYERGDIQAGKAHDRALELLDKTQEFQKEESRLQRELSWKIVQEQMKNSGITTDIIQDADGRYIRTTYDKNTGRTTNEVINPPANDIDPITAKDGSQVSYQTTQDGLLTIDFGPIGVTHNPKRAECGQWFNDKSGMGVGDSYDSKIQATGATKDRIPQVGDAFVTPNGGITLPNGEKSGHIGFVKTVYDDGTIEVVESNFQKVNGVGIVSVRKIGPNDKGRADMSFGQTQFSRDGLNLNKNIKNKEVESALWNLSIKGSAKWWTEELKQGFEGMIKSYGAGSPEISGYLNSIIAKDKGKDGWDKMRDAITGMEKIKSDIEKYSEKYPGEIFGVQGNIQANIDKIQSQLGSSAISQSTRDKLKLQSSILLQLQAYRKSVTGAAASELESKEYRELFPKANDSVSMTSAKVDALLEEFKRIEQQTQRDYLGGDTQYNYIIKGQRPGTAPKEVSISSVVSDNKFPLSAQNEKNFWNTNFGDNVNSLSEFMFGSDSMITEYFNQ